MRRQDGKREREEVKECGMGRTSDEIKERKIKEKKVVKNVMEGCRTG